MVPRRISISQLIECSAQRCHSPRSEDWCSFVEALPAERAENRSFGGCGGAVGASVRRTVGRKQ